MTEMARLVGRSESTGYATAVEWIRDRSRIQRDRRFFAPTVTHRSLIARCVLAG